MIKAKNKTGITLKPFGGLANRMRAIDSALLLAQKYHIQLDILWEMSFELNCSFYKLFQPIAEVSFQEYHYNRYSKRSIDFLTQNLEKAGLHFPLGFKRYYNDQEVLRLKNQNYNFTDIVHYKSVFIHTVNRFYSDNNMFKSFLPVTELQYKINEKCSLFNNNTVGIHIRRSDNKHSVSLSPLEGFIELMKNELERIPGTMFYLATDSNVDEERLKKIFGNRIITHAKILDRNSEEGIKDALIDLYALANTKRIIGSYFSSFSEVAAQIHQIDLKIVFKV
jgi:hypothetical protein